MTVCMETAMADGLEFRIEGASLSKGIGRQAISAPAPGLLAEPASILPVWTAAVPWIAGVARGVPPALLRSVLSISRSELDFKLIELVPLSVGTLPPPVSRAAPGGAGGGKSAGTRSWAALSHRCKKRPGRDKAGSRPGSAAASERRRTPGVVREIVDRVER